MPRSFWHIIVVWQQHLHTMDMARELQNSSACALSIDQGPPIALLRCFAGMTYASFSSSTVVLTSVAGPAREQGMDETLLSICPHQQPWDRCCVQSLNCQQRMTLGI